MLTARGVGGDDKLGPGGGSLSHVGPDTMHGTEGADIFSWTTASMQGGTDHILDFSRHEGDVLRFDDLLGGDQSLMNALLTHMAGSGASYTASDSGASLNLTLDSGAQTATLVVSDSTHVQTIVLQNCDFSGDVHNAADAQMLLQEIITVGG
jgi:hypothetical protein